MSLASRNKVDPLEVDADASVASISFVASGLLQFVDVPTLGNLACTCKAFQDPIAMELNDRMEAVRRMGSKIRGLLGQPGMHEPECTANVYDKASGLRQRLSFFLKGTKWCPLLRPEVIRSFIVLPRILYVPGQVFVFPTDAYMVPMNMNTYVEREWNKEDEADWTLSSISIPFVCDKGHLPKARKWVRAKVYEQGCHPKTMARAERFMEQLEAALQKHLTRVRSENRLISSIALLRRRVLK